MEKAFMNFYYYKDLIENVRDVELTEEEQKNLISVLSGNLNYHDIKSKKDLVNYNDIANKKLLDLINTSDNTFTIRTIIFNDLFGMDFRVVQNAYKFVIDDVH